MHWEAYLRLQTRQVCHKHPMSRTQHLQPTKIIKPAMVNCCLLALAGNSVSLCICVYLSVSARASMHTGGQRAFITERPRLAVQLRWGITNDIMTIFHALQASDVLPTHLLWYLVTDPAVNQRLITVLQAGLLLRLTNDPEADGGCLRLQHVLPRRTSRAPSEGLPYKLRRSLCF